MVRQRRKWVSSFCAHMVLQPRGSEIWGQAKDKCCVGTWLSHARVSFKFTHKCVRVCQLMQILHTCLALDWVLVSLRLCMPAFEWCIAPYLPAPGHMTLSSSLADTICISMKWNLVPLSAPDSWQFRPGQRRAKITPRQTDYLYRRLLPSLSHDRNYNQFKMCTNSTLSLHVSYFAVFLWFLHFEEQMQWPFCAIKFNMILNLNLNI